MCIIAMTVIVFRIRGLGRTHMQSAAERSRLSPIVARPGPSNAVLTRTAAPQEPILSLHQPLPQALTPHYLIVSAAALQLATSVCIEPLPKRPAPWAACFKRSARSVDAQGPAAIASDVCRELIPWDRGIDRLLQVGLCVSPIRLRYPRRKRTLKADAPFAIFSTLPVRQHAARASL